MTPKAVVMIMQAWIADAYLYRIDDREVMSEIERDLGHRPLMTLRVRVAVAQYSVRASNALHDRNWDKAAEYMAIDGFRDRRHWQPLNKGRAKLTAQKAARQRAASLEQRRDHQRGRWAWNPKEEKR